MTGEVLRTCVRNEKECQRKETVALERKNVSFWMWAEGRTTPPNYGWRVGQSF